MDGSLIFIIVGLVVIVGFFILKKAGQLSETEARRLLAEGALIVDVRSEQEFKSEHLPKAVNIPLDQLKERLPSVAPDKQMPLLLHCLSGGRSAMARSMAKGMGYSNVHNLGSLSRARALQLSA